jgi:hypothetical protein
MASTVGLRVKGGGFTNRPGIPSLSWLRAIIYLFCRITLEVYRADSRSKPMINGDFVIAQIAKCVFYC